jgi:hypothetical protein
MNALDLIKQEKDLFERWSKDCPGFIKDGVVEPSKYGASPKKVLYLLKEANDKKAVEEGGWDLKEFLREPNRPQTWDNIALWQYGLENLNKDYNWQELEAKCSLEFRKEQISKIAVVNVKKQAGTHTAKGKQLWEHASTDRELLKEQIDMYKPDLIICCGTPTGSILRKLELVEPFDKWEKTSKGVYYHRSQKGTLVIYYCHPAARIDDNFKFYPLVEGVRELMGAVV